jgi:hypothetical protein
MIPVEVVIVAGAVLGAVALGLAGQAFRFVRRGLLEPTLTSAVPEHEGQCRPTWTNTPGGLNHRLDGGLSGFFRRVRRLPRLPGLWPYGPEFHGIIRGGVVYSTEGMGQ